MSIWKIAVIVLVLAGGYWLVRYLTTPPPGREVEDQGRTHVTAEEVAKTVYKSNPPVSGPHLETWVKPGIYEEPQLKGELLHSLEHGYVEIQYNCAPSADPKNASGSAQTDTPDCKALVKNLTGLAQKAKLFKLIVVPNPQIDSRIALAAWDHLDTFAVFDEKRINTFIDYYRDHGPEQTME
jgi:hypothetical protein